MSFQSKQKRKNFIKKYKGVIIGTSIFVFVGLIALLIGFEIEQDWHAIRNWLTTPYAKTIAILVGCGAVLLAIFGVSIYNIKKGSDL